MQLRSIILYIVGIFLLIFGNRDLWDELQEQREEEKKARRAQAEAGEHLKKEFEIQALEYDSINKKWTNPHVYFQLVNASYINFHAAGKEKSTTIETDDDEDASDTQ